jgi:hypothetical protein
LAAGLALADAANLVSPNLSEAVRTIAAEQVAIAARQISNAMLGAEGAAAVPEAAKANGELVGAEG